MKRKPNIEHPDLSKLTDLELYHEGQYLMRHIEEIADRIKNRAALVAKGYTQNNNKNKVPTISKMADELKLAINRQYAIVEEIEYRAEMMR